MDRGAWQAAVHGVTKSRTQLSADTHTHTPTQESPQASLPGLELQPQLRAEPFQLSTARCSCCTGQKIPGSPRRNRDLIHLQELS